MLFDMLSGELELTKFEVLKKRVRDAVEDFYSFAYPDVKKAPRRCVLRSEQEGQCGAITIECDPIPKKDCEDEQLIEVRVLIEYFRQRLTYVYDGSTMEETPGFLWMDELIETGLRYRIDEKDVIRFTLKVVDSGAPILEGYNWGRMIEYVHLRALAKWLAKDWGCPAMVRWDSENKRFFVLVLYSGQTQDEILQSGVEIALVACTPYYITPKGHGRVVGQVVVKRFANSPESGFTVTLYSKS